MKVIKFILGAALGMVLILVAIGFFLPSRWHVERTVIIKAPVEKIYPLIANLKTGWPQWNTFDKEDPGIQYIFTGPAEGDGATRSWASQKTGVGIQKITKADPKSGIDFEISMGSGGFVIFGSLNMEPAAGGTRVTWRDGGDMGSNPIYKIMGYLMDPMMGASLQKSLDNLKDLAEKNSP